MRRGIKFKLPSGNPQNVGRVSNRPRSYCSGVRSLSLKNPCPFWTP